MTYPVYDISDWLSYDEEAMGSKEKGWYYNPQDSMQARYLFKHPRPGTGEAWSEKAVAEIARIIEIPHAEIELAILDERPGTLSQSFMDSDERKVLFHGNQLLNLGSPDYDKEKTYNQSQHTYHQIIHTIEILSALPPSISNGDVIRMTGLQVFAGYVILDALVCNTDRHHENWALSVVFDEQEEASVRNVYLAPTYDHASSLGRELSDTRRIGMLNDKQRLSAYISRGHTPIYWQSEDRKGANPIELARCAAFERPDLYRPWLLRMADVKIECVKQIFDLFPNGWITNDAAEFAVSLVTITKEQLTRILEELPE